MCTPQEIRCSLSMHNTFVRVPGASSLLASQNEVYNRLELCVLCIVLPLCLLVDSLLTSDSFGAPASRSSSVTDELIRTFFLLDLGFDSSFCGG